VIAKFAGPMICTVGNAGGDLRVILKTIPADFFATVKMNPNDTLLPKAVAPFLIGSPLAIFPGDPGARRAPFPLKCALC
jgi:hypothetical protein